MDFIYWIGLFGVFVSGISGTLTAANKQFDVFSGAIIAFVTVAGGGTLRDLLLDNHPVFWMSDLNYVYGVALAVVIN